MHSLHSELAGLHQVAPNSITAWLKSPRFMSNQFTRFGINQFLRLRGTGVCHKTIQS